MYHYQRKFIAAMSLCAAVAVPGIASAVAVNGQGTWESTLQGRDLDGNVATFEAYYDTVLDITWLADAGYFGGTKNWSTANSWAANLDPYNSGITGWRLPSMTDNLACNFASSGTNCGYNVDPSSSEMAHLFYITLGNRAWASGSPSKPGWGLTNTGPFSNIQPYRYWSNTEYVLSADYAWYFNFYNGTQEDYEKRWQLAAWAVHDGDIDASAVPVPAAVWLLGSGLLGLLGVTTRKKAA